jgi:phospholipid/cholesterol/gamma-HCH transport system ATP-binding protein
VLGPSGTGKSVLLKTTIGLIVPDAGDVIIDGQSVFAADADQLQTIRRKAGYVFQNAALFDSMNVFENVAYGLPEGSLKKLGRREVTRRVARSLEEVNLDPAIVMSKLPAELSGGMRKRVGLARAIVGEPQILLYDEPVTGLDPVNAAAVDRLIADIAERTHVTSIVVTHDVEGRSPSPTAWPCSRGQSALPGDAGRVPPQRRPLVRAFADRQAAVEAALAGSARSSRIADAKAPALP